MFITIMLCRCKRCTRGVLKVIGLTKKEVTEVNKVMLLLDIAHFEGHTLRPKMLQRLDPTKKKKENISFFAFLIGEIHGSLMSQDLASTGDG